MTEKVPHEEINIFRLLPFIPAVSAFALRLHDMHFRKAGFNLLQLVLSAPLHSHAGQIFPGVLVA